MEAKDKFTLGLELPTDPRWINIAELHLEDILVDHAYCEQKAASSGISLIIQYPEKDILVERLTAIVAEEWGHFERVVAELRKRGWKLGKQRRDEYVNALIKKGTVFEEMPSDKSWLWREARLKDPDGNQLILYFAGDNRKNPPWRINK